MCPSAEISGGGGAAADCGSSAGPVNEMCPGAEISGGGGAAADCGSSADDAEDGAAACPELEVEWHDGWSGVRR